MAVGEPSEIIRSHLKILLMKHLGHPPRQYRPLVFGDAHRTIEWRRTVTIEPHERIHAVGVEADEAATGLEHAANLDNKPPRVRKMVHQPTQQHAVEAFTVKRKIF